MIATGHICGLTSKLEISVLFTYEHARPSVTVDLVVFGIDSENFGVKVLLIQRGREPFKGHMAFPGGFLEMNETGEAAARRECLEETGLDISKHDVFFLKLCDAVDRDPRGRVIGLAYALCLPDTPEVKNGDDASSAEWVNVEDIKLLAFDHKGTLLSAYAWLNRNIGVLL